MQFFVFVLLTSCAEKVALESILRARKADVIARDPRGVLARDIPIHASRTTDP